MIPAREALGRLRDGNRRFVSGASSARRQPPVIGAAIVPQMPFAIVLGCSDARVPVELIFDQGIGDLFVIRVAGNVVARSQLGTIEFAVEQFQTRLVVVLGHTYCGAVESTVASYPGQSPRSHVDHIVDRIRPAVHQAIETGIGKDDPGFMDRVMRANVDQGTRQLRNDSGALKRAISERDLLIVGADYALETGEVDFFDVPEA